VWATVGLVIATLGQVLVAVLKSPHPPDRSPCTVSRTPQRFGDSRLGESVLAVWQAVTDSIPVPRTNYLCSSNTVFTASLKIRELPVNSPQRACRQLARNVGREPCCAGAISECVAEAAHRGTVQGRDRIAR
jgi:hypothetical protein